MFYKLSIPCLLVIGMFFGLTAQTTIKLDTVYNFSQAQTATADYQINLPNPGVVTIHIGNWLSTMNWTVDYDRIYVYNDTNGIINREGLSTADDPFLFHMFAGDTNGLTFNIGQAAVYTIAVHSGLLGGQPPLSENYQLSVSEVACNDVNEPNNTMQQATTLQMDATVTAYQWRRVKSAFVNGDDDWYKIAIPSPGQLKLVLSHWTPLMDWTKDYDRLYVYNGKGDSIGYGISTGSSAADPFYEHMMYDSIHTTTMNLSHAGTYYLRYHAGDAYSTTPYTLHPSFTPADDKFEPNDNFTQAKLITASDSFYHAFEWRTADSTMNVAHDEDFYYFQAAAAGPFSITLDSNWIPIFNWSADYDWLTVYAADTTTTIGANPLNWMMRTSPANFTVPSAGKYYIRMHCGDGYSLTGYSFKLTGNTVSSRELHAVSRDVPREFALEKNFPDPFVSSTMITYRLPVDCNVQIKVLDVSGRQVKDLVHEFKTAGRHAVILNGTGLAGGVYLCEMKAGSFVAKRKMSLLR
jgi:hypothetical protein